MSEENFVEVQLRLPKETIGHVELVAKHAAVPVDHVLQVMVVLWMLREAASGRDGGSDREG